MDEYLVPTGYGEDEFIEKKSRFIGRAWLVETEEEALEKIAAMKKQHLMPSISVSLTLRIHAPVSFVSPSPKFTRMLPWPEGKVYRSMLVRVVALTSALMPCAGSSQP